MTSQIDEYFVDTMKTYADKPFCNIATDDLGLETEEEKKETEAKQAEDKDLLDFVKETLGDQVASVRLSNKLVSSAVCLSTEGGVTLEMERYFKSMPGAPTDIRAIRVLELNANHHAYQAMKDFAKEIRKYVPTVMMTVVDTIPKEEIEACRKICEEEVGAVYRVREYIED